MFLAEAREVLTSSVLHVGQTDYSKAKQDHAIKFALQIFLRRTRCDTTATDFTMTAGSATQDVTSVLADFMPYQMVGARIGYKDVDLRNLKELLRELDESSTSARPTMIAWEAKNSALVHPVPDSAYTLRITRIAPLVEFDPGTEQEIELNVPEAFVRDALWFGAGPALVYGESGSLYASEGWRRFEALMKEVAGLAPMGVGSTWKVRQSAGQLNWGTEGARFSAW